MLNFRRNTDISTSSASKQLSNVKDKQKRNSGKRQTIVPSLTSQQDIQNSTRSMASSDKRRLRSHTGPNPSTIVNEKQFYTLPRGESQSRHKSFANPRSKDDSVILRPYMINGPVRPAPPPPSKQQPKKGEMPRRKAPTPPTVVTPLTSLSEDTELLGESLYELPEKSILSANITLKRKPNRDPPPIPSSPRPSLSRYLSLNNVAINEDQYETESIYELEELHYQQSITPPPPLPPRISPVMKPPTVPPISKPPSFKPPPPSSSPVTTPTASIKDDDEYTEMFFSINSTKPIIDEDEYILMDEALECRNRFMQQQSHKQQENVKASEVNELKSNIRESLPPKKDLEEEEENEKYMEMGSGNYVKMMRDALTKNMTAKAPPIPPKPLEDENENCMEMGSGYYVKMMPKNTSAKAPPVPPKPSLSNTNDAEKTRMRFVPKQKLSIPHFPPPDPPSTGTLHEIEESIYHIPTSETEEVYI